MKNYIEQAKLTDVPDYHKVNNRIFQAHSQNLLPLFHAMLGIASESGEFVDVFKKWFLYGKEPDFVNLDEEIGDILWYCAIYLERRGKSFDEIMEQNIAKLKARYPNKFNEADALNRDLKREYKILEEGGR